MRYSGPGSPALGQLRGVFQGRDKEFLYSRTPLPNVFVEFRATLPFINRWQAASRHWQA
jgi:hypothetical protein